MIDRWCSYCYDCPRGCSNCNTPVSKGGFIPDEPTPRPTDNDIIKKYSEVLASIYDNRTAGDYTFTGVLATFLNEINEIH